MSVKLNIGLFGFGVVGQGFYNLLKQSAYATAEVTRICIKEPDKERSLPGHLFTCNPEKILRDEAINLIVELISDPGQAMDIVRKALKRGLPVVTANKKMVAENLPELIELQQDYGGTLLYEASCCGSIPVIKLLNSYYNYEQITRVSGIFNGSSNYILTKIFQEGLPYPQALKQAQDLGFAEEDPVLDVGGFDALNKLCIMAAHAFGIRLNPEHVFNTGIDNISQADINYAREYYLKIKLLASVTMDPCGRVYPLVIPAFVRKNEETYGVENELNMVSITTELSGTHVLKGNGAGAYPTGLAVLSDVRSVTRGTRYAYPRPEGPVSYHDNFSLKVYLRYQDESILHTLEAKPLEKRFWQEEKSVLARVSIRKLIENKDLLKTSGVFIAAAPGALDTITDTTLKVEKKQRPVLDY